MQTNILEYLEHTVKKMSAKVAFANDEVNMTFDEVYNCSRSIGTYLSNNSIYREPVVVFMSKSPKTIAAFLGVVYAGNYYVPLDEEMPMFRIKLILETLKPKVIICDNTTKQIIEDLEYNKYIFNYDEISSTEIDDKKLANIRGKSIDTDPLYIVFTSGSTGVPKGVIACHRSVIDYVEHLTEVLGITEDTVLANQSPLYFDACLKEIFSTLKYGATTHIVPKSLFMFPVKLVEYLNDKKINTVCWVVSALTMISAFKTFRKVVPEYLHTIAFGSEVFPIKQFNIWKETLPNARFINLYGPTEATGMCCYYEVEKEFNLDDVIPIGKPFKNTEIILLDKDDKEPKEGKVGEICVRGTSLTLGYYEDPDKTDKVFVQNPLNDRYHELIYRTGDLGRYNEFSELVFVSRKDYQIKHMGHRIELGEIEVYVNMLDEIKSSCCIYDKEKGKIVLYYVGDINNADLIVKLKEKLPRYMVPNSIIQLDVMPFTPNGKIDRKYLSEKYKDTYKENN